jgi:hypothetical protein
VDTGFEDTVDALADALEGLGIVLKQVVITPQ